MSTYDHEDWTDGPIHAAPKRERTPYSEGPRRSKLAKRFIQISLGIIVIVELVRWYTQR